jgi:hypothetical protein
MPKQESYRLYRHWHNLDSSQPGETLPMVFKLLEMFKEILNGRKEELGKWKMSVPSSVEKD